MERMRVALEKARREREAVRSGHDRPAPPVLDVPTPREEVAAKPAAPSPDLDIDAARAVNLNPRTLLRNRIVSGIHHKQYADLYRILRAQTLLRLSEGNKSTLAITSATAGEGKTLTSINLALSLAKDVNQSVLLVDLDLRRSAVHRYLGFRPEAGLTEVLTGNASLSDVIVNPGAKRLLVLPNRTALSESSEVLKSPRMVELATQLANLSPEWFVVYDMPPVLVSDDCISFMRHVGGCLLVVEEGKSSTADVARAADLLQDHNLIGTVLNKASPVNADSGYYYQYSSNYAPRNVEAAE